MLQELQYLLPQSVFLFLEYDNDIAGPNVRSYRPLTGIMASFNIGNNITMANYNRKYHNNSDDLASVV